MKFDILKFSRVLECLPTAFIWPLINSMAFEFVQIIEIFLQISLAQDLAPQIEKIFILHRNKSSVVRKLFFSLFGQSFGNSENQVHQIMFCDRNETSSRQITFFKMKF